MPNIIHNKTIIMVNDIKLGQIIGSDFLNQNFSVFGLLFNFHIVLGAKNWDIEVEERISTWTFPLQMESRKLGLLGASYTFFPLYICYGTLTCKLVKF